MIAQPHKVWSMSPVLPLVPTRTRAFMPHSEGNMLLPVDWSSYYVRRVRSLIY